MNLTKLGEKIKNRRLELGMTQLELSEKSGVSQEYISVLENGKRNPSFTAIVHLCSALHMTTDELARKQRGAEE